jgi:hypothetical protein
MDPSIRQPTSIRRKSAYVSETGSSQKHTLEDAEDSDDLMARLWIERIVSPAQRQNKAEKKRRQTKKAKHGHNTSKKDRTGEPKKDQQAGEPFADPDGFESENGTESSESHTPPPLIDPRITFVTPETFDAFGVENLSSARKRKLTVYDGKLNSLLKIVKLVQDDALSRKKAKSSTQWHQFLENVLNYLVRYPIVSDASLCS